MLPERLNGEAADDADDETQDLRPHRVGCRYRRATRAMRPRRPAGSAPCIFRLTSKNHSFTQATVRGYGERRRTKHEMPAKSTAVDLNDIEPAIRSVLERTLEKRARGPYSARSDQQVHEGLER